MRRIKKDNDDDDGFLLLLIFIILLIFFIFYVVVKYRIISEYMIVEQIEKTFVSKSKIIKTKESNTSSLVGKYSVAKPHGYNKGIEQLGEKFIASQGDHFYRTVMLNSNPIEDLNISLTDVIFETNRYTVFLIVYHAEQLIKAYKLYNSKRGLSPKSINNLVTQRILTSIPEEHELVTKTGWALSDNTNVGANNISFILNLDGLADNEMKLDFCNIVNFYANNEWSLQSTEADIIALGSGKSILENGYAKNNDAFFCYSTGTAGEYKFQLVFAKWTGR